MPRKRKTYQMYFFRDKDQERLKPNWHQIRQKAQKEISPQAQLKLEWIIYYYTQGKENASATASQFGITRKTIHKWLKRFKRNQLATLEEITTAPHKTRTRQINLIQRTRIRHLREKYPSYGKMKLVSIYQQDYGEQISSWKIQKVIEENELYFDKPTIFKRRKRKLISIKRMKITKLVKENKVNHLWHVDTVILTLAEGGYRYLITAIDDVSKLAYARLYTYTHTSASAKDFLERLLYVTDNQIINIHTDNGSEFLKEFSVACRTLKLPHYFSRPHTPKDNSVLERFNRTIQEEFVEITDIDPYYTIDFNQKLTDWLIEYNSHRPHQTLDYQTPLQYLDNYYLQTQQQVLPIYSSST
ncbi:DDE-type integrase/transposase/recombinase [Candidatus Daviesbacteria bacterium]|nr:DDE-type integrase/transposase/recombinase [Candidatus Daviesbacteria bacterium]